MDKTNINNTGMSDNAIAQRLGLFIKHHRLDQNKTQSQLAKEAGMNRSTVFEFEHGRGGNLVSFIQLLRSLNQLSLLEQFEITQQISPLQLAEMEHAKRKRASKPRSKKQTSKTKKK